MAHEPCESELEFDRYQFTDTDTDIAVSVWRIFKPIPISPSPILNRYRYISMIPIYLYDTDIEIYDTDIALG